MNYFGFFADLVNTRKDAGKHEIQWDAVSQPAGVYTCRLETEASGRIQIRAVRKMQLIR